MKGRLVGFAVAGLFLTACGGGTTSSVIPISASSIATESLVAAWTFNENTGTSAADSSSSAAHPFALFNYTDNSHWITGFLGNALTFSKTLRNYGTATWSGSESFQLKTANAFSISLWFKIDAATYNADSTFANQYMLFWQGATGQNCWGNSGGTASSNEICLSVNYIPNNAGNRLAFFMGQDEGLAGHIGIQSALSLTTNPGWHHVAVTVSGANSGSATATLYVNGTEGAAVSGSSVPGATDTGTQLDRSLWVDQLYVGRPISSTRDFAGSIDDLRIYNRALTATEVAALRASNAQ